MARTGSAGDNDSNSGATDDGPSRELAELEAAGADADDDHAPRRSTPAASSSSSSDAPFDDDDDDDDASALQIAARAGIRLLEENAHFREEVLRLQEHVARLEDTGAGLTRALADRDAQLAQLGAHLRESIRENQGLLSELTLAREELVEAQRRLATGPRASPRKRLRQPPLLIPPTPPPSQQQEPQSSLSTETPMQLLDPTLILEQLELVQAEFANDAAAPSSIASESAGPLMLTAIESPAPLSGSSVATTVSSASPLSSPISSPTRRGSVVGVRVGGSPRRRQTLARLREAESRYDEEHERSSALRLELQSAQRRLAELRPLPAALTAMEHDLAVLRAELTAAQTQLAHAHAERREEAELIQSLRHTVEAYQSLNFHDAGAANLGPEDDVPLPEALTDAQTADGAPTSPRRTTRSRAATTEELEHLDRAADMLGARFHLREENERLLQQLTALTDQVLALKLHESITLLPKATSPRSNGERDVDGEDGAVPMPDQPQPYREHRPVGSGGSAVSSPTRARAPTIVGPVGLGSGSRLRYLEQQVSVLQTLLRRFRLEWQHAHDARVCLEQEKADLLVQLDRLRTRVRNRDLDTSNRDQDADAGGSTAASTSERRRGSKTTAPIPDNDDDPDAASPIADEPSAAATAIATATTTNPENRDDDDDDCLAAAQQRLWESTSAVCEAILRQSRGGSKEDEAEADELCFALLRRLIDSWTTDKPKRMRLHDWLTNAIRGTGIRKPLYLHELSSELAMGFQTLLIPILREKFGVHVHVDKRLRNVIVTDLRIQVAPPPPSEPASEASGSASASTSTSRPRCAPHINHALLTLIDAEAGHVEEKAWVGAFARRKSARLCLGK